MKNFIKICILLAMVLSSCTKEAREPMTSESPLPWSRVENVMFDNESCVIKITAEFNGYGSSFRPQEFGIVYDVENNLPTVEDGKIVITSNYEDDQAYTLELTEFEYLEEVFVRSYSIYENEIYYSSSSAKSITPVVFIGPIESTFPVIENCGSEQAVLRGEFVICLPEGYEYGVVFNNVDGISTINRKEIKKGNFNGEQPMVIEFNIAEESEGRSIYRFYLRDTVAEITSYSAHRYLPSVGYQPEFTKLDDFPGPARAEAVGFSFNGFGYVCGGYSKGREDFYNDLWRYDPSLNEWQQMADLPVAGRALMTSFTTENYFYVGLGGTDTNGISGFSSIFRYNPEENEWNPIKDFPVAGVAALSFSLEGKGYIGTVLKNNDDFDYNFYQYDEEMDDWIAKAPFPESFMHARNSATTWKDKGIVCLQFGHFNKYFSYDATLDQWDLLDTQTIFDGNDGIALEINEQVYQLTGRNAPVMLRLDFDVNKVTPLCIDPAIRRSEAVGFAIGDAIYVIGGVKETIATDIAEEVFKSVYKIQL